MLKNIIMGSELTDQKNNLRKHMRIQFHLCEYIGSWYLCNKILVFLSQLIIIHIEFKVSKVK